MTVISRSVFGRNSPRGRFKFVLAVLAIGHVVAPAGPLEASAPPGRFLVSADTVQDAVTGLTWQRQPSPAAMTWVDATAYCTGAWRLPRIKELQSIVDYKSGASVLIDVAVFPGTPAGSFWSSTVDQLGGPTTYAWVVDFRATSQGGTWSDLQASPFFVRCVAG